MFVLEELKQIETETASYKALVQEEQWEKLSELTASRQKRLESIFTQKIDENLVAQVTSSIQRILALDKEYADAIDHQRIGETNNIINIKSKFKAAKQYKSIHEST